MNSFSDWIKHKIRPKNCDLKPYNKIAKNIPDLDN